MPFNNSDLMQGLSDDDVSRLFGGAGCAVEAEGNVKRDAVRA